MQNTLVVGRWPPAPKDSWWVGLTRNEFAAAWRTRAQELKEASIAPPSRLGKFLLAQWEEPNVVNGRPRHRQE